MIPAIAFIGHHNSGKTRLLEELIPLFVGRGYRIGVAKHARDQDTFDDSGADSGRLRAVGADRVLLRGEDRSILDWHHGPDEPAEPEIDRLFAGCDLVLLEGWKRGSFPKIEVFRSVGARREPLAGEIEVVAVVTDDHVAIPDGVVVCSPRRIEEVADLVERIAMGRSGPKIACSSGA